MTIKLGNSTLGFSDTKTAMQKVRVEDTLNKLWRYDGNVMSEKEFVLTKLFNGYTTEMVENYTYYKRNGEMSKPKTIYKLMNSSERTYNEISKTAYDFLNYVIENNFTDENIINEYVKNEKEEMERLEREQLKKEQEERERREVERLKEKEERQKIQQEKMKQWNEIGIKVFTDEHKTIVSNVVVEFWEEIKIRTEQTIEEFTNTLIDRTIQNIGNNGYMLHIVSYLIHDELNKNNLTNKIDKSIYTKIFNVMENDPKITITAKIKAFYKGTEYKGSKPIVLDNFYVYTKEGYELREGEKRTIEGYECYITKNNGKYTITEGKTGLGIITKENKTEAINKAKELITNKKDLLNSNITSHINKNGISPLFIEQAVI